MPGCFRFMGETQKMPVTPLGLGLPRAKRASYLPENLMVRPRGVKGSQAGLAVGFSLVLLAFPAITGPRAGLPGRFHGTDSNLRAD